MTLALFAKRPLPGAVKTRLAAELGAERAAALYRAMLHDAVARGPVCGERVLVAHAPGDAATAAEFRDWIPADVGLWGQPEGTLSDRLARFFSEFLRAPNDRAIALGTDGPTLPSRFLQDAWQALRDCDVVIAPAFDGGYCLIGLRGTAFALDDPRRRDERIARCFAGIPWSGPDVLLNTVERIAAEGLSLRLLPPWHDIDTLADLKFLSGWLAAQRLSSDPIVAPRTAEWIERELR